MGLMVSSERCGEKSGCSYCAMYCSVLCLQKQITPHMNDSRSSEGN